MRRDNKIKDDYKATITKSEEASHYIYIKSTFNIPLNRAIYISCEQYPCKLYQYHLLFYPSFQKQKKDKTTKRVDCPFHKLY